MGHLTEEELVCREVVCLLGGSKGAEPHSLLTVPGKDAQPRDLGGDC